MLKYWCLVVLIGLSGGLLIEERIDLSLQTSAVNPSVGEIIWVDLHADSVQPREYNTVILYIQYDPEHLTLLDWAPRDIEWRDAGFPGRGKDIDYICRDEAGQEYTCDADTCRNLISQCTKIYTDFVSTVIHNKVCRRPDPDPDDGFAACFNDPPAERPINQEIDDGEAGWSAQGKYRGDDIAMTPSIPASFSFRVRQRGTSCVRISESWKPFPGGNRHGGGPPDYEHNVTEMTPKVLFASGFNLLGTLTDVCIDSRESDSEQKPNRRNWR